MSKQILRDVMVRVNGIDISAICRSITLETVRTMEETTIYGSQYHQYIAGLDETQIDLELLLGVTGSPVVTEPTLDPPVVPGGTAYWNGLLFGPWSQAGSTAIVDIAPHNLAAASTNPWTTVTALLVTWRSLAGAVGEAATGSMSLKASGTVTVNTA